MVDVEWWMWSGCGVDVEVERNPVMTQPTQHGNSHLWLTTGIALNSSTSTSDLVTAIILEELAPTPMAVPDLGSGHHLLSGQYKDNATITPLPLPPPTHLTDYTPSLPLPPPHTPYRLHTITSSPSSLHFTDCTPSLPLRPPHTPYRLHTITSSPSPTHTLQTTHHHQFLMV